MENEKKSFKSLKVNVDTIIRLKSLQLKLKEDNGYTRHISISEIITDLLDERDEALKN